jgi:HK97 gp10 family phage protein
MAVKNADRLIRRLNQLPLDARDGIGKALAASVVQMDAYAKDKIQGGGRTGRVYRRRSVSHQASAPGEYPKTDTGQLVASLFFRVGGDRLSAFFGTRLDYGRYLEFGTVNMRPRPWLKPTLQANAKSISERVAKAVQEALKKARSNG